MSVRGPTFFALLILCVVLIIRAATQHDIRIDLSAQRSNSLSDAATQAIDALPGELEITAFVPELATQRAQIDRLLAPYVAHPRDVRVRFVDPVKHPDAARSADVRQHGELHLRAGPRHEVIARPSTKAIDAALHRLARRGERWVLSLRGHGEAQPDSTPRGTGRFTTHIEAQGFRVVAVDPRQVDSLPDNTAVLLIAAPTEAYNGHSRAVINEYINRGGSVLWLSDALPPALPGLRMTLLPGTVVDAAAARFGLDRPDNAIIAEYPQRLTNAPSGASVLKRARALQWQAEPAWQLAGSLDSGPRSWNETSAVSGQLSRDVALGEQAGPLTTGVLFEYTPNGGTSGRVAVVGASFIDNDQVGQGANLQLATALINWLSGNEQLVSPAPPPDLDIRWSSTTGAVLAVTSMAVLPLAYLLVGLWLRARRRRA